MRILILGSSRVGDSLACELVDQGCDVTVVCDDIKSLKNMQQQLDIRTVGGSPSYPDVLRSARADQMDVIIAATVSDEVNMIACQVAYSLFKVPVKMARIRSDHYFIKNELFGNENLPIDVFLNPEDAVASSVLRLIQNIGATGVFPFDDMKLSLVLVKVTKDSSLSGRVWHKVTTEIEKLNSNAVAVQRNNKYLRLRRDFKLLEHDEIYIISPQKLVQSLLLKFGFSRVGKVSRVIIAGGGGVGAIVAKKMLKISKNIKVIDHDKEVCSQLSRDLRDVTVLQGDASERELLFQENVEGIDVFCALTSDDEDNIISSLQAKYLGAKHALSLVNNSEYMEIFAKSNIDAFVSPQQSSISHVLTLIQPIHVTQVYTLSRGVSEIMSFEIMPEKATGIVGKNLSTIKFPEGVVFCALYRDGDIIFKKDVLLDVEDSLLFFLQDKNMFSTLNSLFE